MAGGAPACVSSVAAPGKSGVPSYILKQKWRTSPDSWVLRFQLPDGQRHLGPDDPTLPTCISV
eukprot:CAMPEP_0197463226 /NCGR_PEP_ID=MMETSP1175-20131217/61235_1 /TAXON_ID=1003142 /ORGANISM="Triceratium dubium, Strain CCMP147" /LENGTH=62 /DNA_ID=CAMNT_0042998933 /DNA_START=66 /DNA_END=250 /DNA_ORIENTATION=+